MTLTIEVPDEIAARVHALRGEDRRRVDELAATAVAAALDVGGTPEKFGNFAATADGSPITHTPPNFDTAKMYWEQFAANASRNISNNLPPWAEDAFSRESIYEDRW